MEPLKPPARKPVPTDTSALWTVLPMDLAELYIEPEKPPAYV